MIDCNLFCVGFYERKSFGELWSYDVLHNLNSFNLYGLSKAVIQSAWKGIEPTDRL